MLEGMMIRSLATKMPNTLGMANMVTGVEEMMVMGTTVNHETITNGTGMMGFTTTTTMQTLTGFLVSWEVVTQGIIEGRIEEVKDGIIEDRLIKKLMVHNVVNNLHGE